MLLQLLLLLIVIFFCTFKKQYDIVILLIAFLPIHGTVKTLMFADGGDIFAFWKEIAIMILFLKTISRNRYLKMPNSYKMFFIVVAVFSLVGYLQSYPISSDLKNLLIPGVLFYSLANITLNENQFRNILLCIILSSLVINLTGIIDFISPTIRFVFKDLMKVGYTISSDGTVYYDINSYTMLGKYDRVCGLMSGGPNMMGVYNSIVFLIGCIFYITYRKTLKSGSLFFYYLSFLLCIFCLLFSFSRAGWAICFITFVFYAKFTWSANKDKILNYIFIFLLIIITTYIVSDSFNEVVSSTMTGKEASSAQRGSMTVDALNVFFKNPLGNGLGATSWTNTNKVYFAESFYVNTMIQIGIIGFIIMMNYYKDVYNIIKQHIYTNHIARWGKAFMIALVITSFVSVNMNEVPFNYFAWMFLGLCCNGRQCQNQQLCM